MCYFSRPTAEQGGRGREETAENMDYHKSLLPRSTLCPPILSEAIDDITEL